MEQNSTNDSGININSHGSVQITLKSSVSSVAPEQKITLTL